MAPSPIDSQSGLPVAILGAAALPLATLAGGIWFAVFLAIALLVGGWILLSRSRRTPLCPRCGASMTGHASTGLSFGLQAIEAFSCPECGWDVDSHGRRRASVRR